MASTITWSKEPFARASSMEIFPWERKASLTVSRSHGPAREMVFPRKEIFLDSPNEVAAASTRARHSSIRSL